MTAFIKCALSLPLSLSLCVCVCVCVFVCGGIWLIHFILTHTYLQCCNQITTLIRACDEWTTPPSLTSFSVFALPVQPGPAPSTPVLLSA